MTRLIVNNGRKKKAYPVQIGTPLAEVLASLGIAVELPCGGRGTCGGCRLLLKGKLSRPTPEETAFFSPALLRAGWRLGCQATIRGDTEVILPSGARDRRPDVLVSHRPAGSRVVGAAVDLGTTTLAVSLVDLATGRRLVTVNGLNPQAAKGSDLITRLQQALSPEGQDLLQKMLVSGINILIKEAAGGAGIIPEQVAALTIVGNPVMHHLFLGLPVQSLSRSPFTPAKKGAYYTTAKELGLAVHPRAGVYVAPLIGGFVGGDASAALLFTGLAVRAGKRLLVDLGTNGEIILADNGRLWAASTAAGPAFEGQGIAWGMRAEPGAVTGLKIAAGWRLETVGGEAARGIAGSGLVAIVAGLLTTGLLTPEGRLKNPAARGAGLPAAAGERLRAGENGPEILLDHQTGISLTQKDIRLLQLAKGAIRAAVDSLLDEAGITAESLDGVFLAGAFGSGLDPDAVLRIGLLPRVLPARVEFVGNAALEGAVLALRPEGRKEMERLAGGVRHIPLETRQDYRDKFIAALQFPD